MRTRSAMIVLVAASVVAFGLFMPNLASSGQYAGSVLSTPAPLIPPAVMRTAMHGHGGGVFHGGGAWRGGGVWHGGGNFGGRNFYGYRGYVEPYYVQPTCDWVWDSDVDQWVCASDYY